MTTFMLTAMTAWLPLAVNMPHIGGGLGGLLFLIGWVWMMTMAFPDHIGWGLFVLLLPGLGALVYGIVRWPGPSTPLILVVVGLLLGGGFNLL